jgi:hypothetical protein
MPAPLPASHPNAHHLLPGLRVRHDGWTRERVSRFLELLAHHGCVRDAARVAGLSNESAYRMKRRFPRFSKAWDGALDNAGKGLLAIAYNRAVEGKASIVIRNGVEYERRITPSDSILALLIKRGDLKGGKGARANVKMIPAQSAITFTEYYDQHIRFAAGGKKVALPDPAIVQKITGAKIERIMASLKAQAERGEDCPCCRQTLPPDWPRQSMVELAAMGVLSFKTVFGDAGYGGE